MKPTTRILSGLILFAGLSAASLADDTDIYLDPLTPTGSEPLVMFTLDYRANMNANQCNVANTVASIEATCGYSNSFSTTLFNDGSGVDGKITLYEVIRAALGEVLDGTKDVKVGLMMPHENTTAAGGCAPTDTECSNGAMVMMGFSSIEAGDANGNKQKFKDILKSIPATAITGLPDYHPYQLKEMYFELFRYLTGGKIVGGHLGWQDFDDSNAAKTTNLDAGEAMAPEHAFETGILANGFKTVLSTGKTFAAGSTTTTLELAPSEPAAADYAGKLITVNGETTLITAYNGAQDRATVSPALSVAPVSTDSYEVTQINYPMWDAGVEDGAGNYVSPLTGNNCTKVFVINIGFGTANGDNDLDSYIQQATSPDSSLGMGLTLSGSNTQAQVVQFMKDVDLAVGNFNVDPDPIDGTQNVTSYFIMQSANNTQHAWAAAGGTGNAIDLGSDPDEVIETISNIFKSILAVSTTFVAPSVPVNVFNRAQTVNEVFLALFEADETGLPIWNGNLKKVFIGTNASTGNLELQDANGVQAIDIDGRLKRDALTFYTDGTTLPAPASDEVANKDGRAIARGGVGQQMPGIVAGNPGDENSDAGARKLYTENPGNTFAYAGDLVATDGLTPLDAVVDIATEFWQELAIDSGVSAAPTYGDASATDAERAKALNALAHARGLVPIVDSTLTATAGAPSPRAWMLGDPLHSRPRPINYGARGTYTNDNPDIRIVIGTNDGFLHMFRNTTAGVPDPAPPAVVPGLNVQAGNESWAFMPQAAMKTLNRWQENVAGEPKHPNTTDGSPVVIVKDGNLDGTIDNAVGKNPDCTIAVGPPTDADCDQVIVIFGMRRGGDNIYAIDATDPDNPKFLWRIDGGSGDFLELTQTWSQPSIGKVRLETSPNVFEDFDVLVFGGGYNGDDDGTNSFDLCDANDDGVLAGAELTCKNTVGKDLANRITRHNKSGSLNPAIVATSEGLGIDDPEGNAIFMINAQTGALIWKATIDKIDATSTTFDATTNTLGVPAMKDSIPGEITAVDTNGTGFLDRIYAADTGGNVWRFDLGGLVDTDGDSVPDTLEFTDKTVWTSVKLFEAGRHFNAVVADDRRFFNRVDVAQTRDGVGAFDAILLGSGDREDPLGTARSDWFYLIKDRSIDSGYPPSSTVDHNGLADLSNNCLQTGTIASCGIDQNKFNAGWRISLSSSSGEKNLAASVTSGGNIFFTTFAPEPVASSCGLSEGVGRFYALSLQDATGIFNFDTTNDTSGTTYERSDTLGSGGIPVEVVPLGGGMILVQGQEVGENIVATGGKTGFKTYWYEMPTF